MTLSLLYTHMLCVSSLTCVVSAAVSPFTEACQNPHHMQHDNVAAATQSLYKVLALLWCSFIHSSCVFGNTAHVSLKLSADCIASSKSVLVCGVCILLCRKNEFTLYGRLHM